MYKTGGRSKLCMWLATQQPAEVKQYINTRLGRGLREEITSGNPGLGLTCT